MNPESYLDDIDGSFYVIGYLRSWAFEAQLRDFLRSEFGNDWFARREAGDLLRELWSLGQGPTADELLKDVTGAKLEMASVADRIREGLSAPRGVDATMQLSTTASPAVRRDGARRALRPLRRASPTGSRCACSAIARSPQDAVQDAFLDRLADCGFVRRAPRVGVDLV